MNFYASALSFVTHKFSGSKQIYTFETNFLKTLFNRIGQVGPANK
jgi:hypothetical protein